MLYGHRGQSSAAAGLIALLLLFLSAAGDKDSDYASCGDEEREQ